MQENHNDYTPSNAYEKTGDILKKNREYKKITPEQVNQDLKIRPRLLKAIEESHYKLLPDPTSLAALVKSYGNYLGLEGDVLSCNYKEEVKGLQKKIDVDFPKKLPRRFKLSPYLFLLSFIIISIIVFYSFLEDNKYGPLTTNPEIIEETIEKKIEDPLVIEEKKAPSIQLESPVSENSVVKEEKKNIQNLPEETEKQLLIQAKPAEKSWVEIRNIRGRIIFSGILEDGKTQSITPKDGLTLDVGNNPALDIFLGELPLTIGKQNQKVIKNFSLSLENLQKRVNE